MPAEAKIAILCITLGATFGLLLLSVLIHLPPEWKNRYITRRSWTIGAIATAVSILMSVGHIIEGRPYLGGYFAAVGAAALIILTGTLARVFHNVHSKEKQGMKPS